MFKVSLPAIALLSAFIPFGSLSAQATPAAPPVDPADPGKKDEYAQGQRQPGDTPPIGPIDVNQPQQQPPPPPSAAAPNPPTSVTPPPPAAPGSEPAPGTPPAEAAPAEEPLDVKFEIQSVRDDVQGVVTDLENFKFQWQRERDLHTAITTRGLLINGVIQTDFGWLNQNTTNAVTYARRSTFFINAAIIGFSGTLYKDYEEGRNLTYNLRYGASPQTNTTNSFLNVLDANIQYSVMPTINTETPALTVTAGQQLLPFGIEVPATEELKPVIRNAEFTTSLNLARRDIGLIVRGDLFPQVDYGYSYRQALIAYAFGVINGSGPNTQDDNDHKDLIGRLAFTVPTDYHSWLRQITIGGTAYWGKQNTFLSDGKTLSGKGTKQRYGVDVYYNHWPFGLTYEFIVAKDAVTTGATLADPGRADITRRSHTGTLFLSFGEQFVAGFRNQGRYDDWWPKTWQPFLRFDSLLRDTRNQKTRVDIYTLGFNVFFAETTKFQLNLNHRVDKQNPLGPSNEILAQLQFGF